MVPSKIRTILIINVVLAVAFTVVQAMWNDGILRQFTLALAFIVAVMIAPAVLVQNYLYGKKKGWWYRLRNPDEFQTRLATANDAWRPYPRTRPTDGEVAAPTTQNPRTSLFGELPPGGVVSRASILESVAVRLEAEGKKDAAKRCHDLIKERYSNDASI